MSPDVNYVATRLTAMKPSAPMAQSKDDHSPAKAA
jgi:hypothetical protein